MDAEEAEPEKNKNFPDSKISTAKTFRIKCVNRDIDDFATNARKTQTNHKNVAKLLKYSLLESSSIVQTVSRLSGQLLNCLVSFWVVQKVSGLSGQFLDCRNSF